MPQAETSFRDVINLLIQNRVSAYLRMTVLFMIKHLPEVLMPVFMGQVIDIAAHPTPRRMVSFWAWVIGMIFLVLQNPFVAFFYTKKMTLAVKEIGAFLRNSIFLKMMNASIVFHNRMGAGRLQSKLLNDVRTIEDQPRGLFECVIMAGMMGIAALVMLLIKAPVMLLLIVPAVVIILVLSFFFVRKLESLSHNHRMEFESLGRILSESVHMLPVIKCHSLEDHACREVDTGIRSEIEANLRFQISSHWFGSSLWVCNSLAMIVFYAAASMLLMRGMISVGTAVTSGLYFFQIIFWLQNIVWMLPDFARTQEALRSIREVTDNNDQEPRRGSRSCSDLRGALEVRNVGYRYPGANVWALDDLTLSIPHGASVALVGPSGSGKTTIMNILLGLIRPDQGICYVDGIPLPEFDISAYRRRMASVPQEARLFSGTVRENICHGLQNVSSKTIERALDMTNMLECIRGLPHGLDARVGDGGISLSGGQKQRITIARAFVRDPAILFLDEPTSSLDVETQYQIKEALMLLMKGRTTVIATHSLAIAGSVDQIAIIQDGKLMTAGSHEELIEKENFYSNAMQRILA